MAKAAAAPNFSVSASERTRLAAVHRFEILDTPADATLDRITAMAARRFGAPIALISIVDEDRVWFKSHFGLALTRIDREPGLCASAILSDKPHILVDIKADSDADANSFVTEFGFRFYAGVPLRTSNGHNLGTLCVIDTEPRVTDQDQIDDLKDFASIVVDQMEAERAARQAASRADLMAREIDHRVMNSLQFIAGILAMQSRSPDLGAAAAQLQLAANRVAAVAQVHRHFYVDDADTTSCIEFIRRLCSDLVSILGRQIEVRGDIGTIPSTWVQPIGLLVNELVTNAAKHGEGLIEVHYDVHGDRSTLTVTDQGEGLPAGFDPRAIGNSLGMRVVHSLAAQLGGSLAAGNTSAGGSFFRVSFRPSPANSVLAPSSPSLGD
ncbi:sensor histidine kinase [Sphingobium yanoikuyae]|uniref:sensor histidine kinase n=1 Tax=Sphingobium yanoikuyae TaxID=13690 RepID=UPI00241DACE4|nr:histidine kinase dimerization/phosphoacceptor domain -containing protein [Sphingobium yanoikuyae]